MEIYKLGKRGRGRKFQEIFFKMWVRKNIKLQGTLYTPALIETCGSGEGGEESSGVQRGVLRRLQQGDQKFIIWPLDGVKLQPDQINMAVFFWYLAKSDLSNVDYCTCVQWTSHFLQLPETNV